MLDEKPKVTRDSMLDLFGHRELERECSSVISITTALWRLLHTFLCNNYSGYEDQDQNLKSPIHGKSFNHTESWQLFSF